MERLLDEVEARVVGCLVEKDLATPEYYPLTLNALTNACNQKSNREPVMLLESTDVVRALDSLRQKQMAHQSAEGVRAAKYCHNLEGVLNLDPEDLAILAELLLRGPQTVGELRNRAERMYSVGDLHDVEELLQNLEEREEPLVTRLPRQPGRKEHRFAHLLSGTPEIEETSALPAEPARLQVAAENDRIAKLEGDVDSLRTEMEELRSQLQSFQAQFE
ncbi:MAG: YceH family protein [Desulfuromonadales bacterium]|nr:YceH family protein [Desulfuromonadales bacterium]